MTQKNTNQHDCTNHLEILPTVTNIEYVEGIHGIIIKSCCSVCGDRYFVRYEMMSIRNKNGEYVEESSWINDLP